MIFAPTEPAAVATNRVNCCASSAFALLSTKTFVAPYCPKVAKSLSDAFPAVTTATSPSFLPYVTTSIAPLPIP